MSYKNETLKATNVIREKCRNVDQLAHMADLEIAALKKRIDELENDPNPPSEWDVHDAHAELLSNRCGFADAERVGGGSGGEVVVVRTAAETRDACSDSSRPAIILLDESVDGDRWTLRSKRDEFKPRENKTIWAMSPEGKKVDLEIRADWKGGGAAFRLNKSNVIISGFKGSWGSRPENDDAPDFVQVTSTCRGAWIHDIDFTGTGTRDEDGVVDCYGIATFSHSVVRRAWKCHLVKGTGRLTIWQNSYENIGGRVPHVGDHAQAHLHRSRISNNGNWSYIAQADGDGRLLVTDNEFVYTKRTQLAVKIDDDGRWGDDGHSNDFDGMIVDRERGHGFHVPYDY